LRHGKGISYDIAGGITYVGDFEKDKKVGIAKIETIDKKKIINGTFNADGVGKGVATLIYEF
jgi:hypothetical protein